MKILLCGSQYHKGDSKALEQVILQLLQLGEEHQLTIEERFYSYLLSAGYDLSVARVLPSYGASSSTVHTDLLVTIGGDGTFLRSARLIAGTEARILGINSGRLGFLANAAPEHFQHYWEEIITGKAVTEERTLLEATTITAQGKRIEHGPILNEVAIIKRDTASMIKVDMEVNGEHLATYEGDGVLISTPTGSTAYSLSVGGAIIHPLSPVMAVSPIATHMLTMRPIVLPDDVEISARISSRTGSYLLACDGKSTPKVEGDMIQVRRSSRRLRVLHATDYSFYETLRNKLMWGKDLRS